MEDDCCATQLIDGNGNFNVQGLENFTNKVKLAECGLSYAVVAIMGPQCSGKSTLLNHLFHTNFREMDAYNGRSQTTKGIWIAKGVGIEPCTIAMDLEGTDGRERGEDDTAFEKQSALFALAVSDIVLINMWCHDIGRERAAHKPLLKTVFQVMMRLFSPHKSTLLFVIRDKTKTPLERLKPVLRKDIQKIWDAVPKPQAHENTPLSEFFNFEITALSNYEEKEEKFKEEVTQLRQQFFHSISPGGLAGDRRGVVPASGFSFSAELIWKVIKENKDLDLPAHKVIVATVRCEEIANEKLCCLTSDKAWLALEEAVQAALVSSFGKQLSSILEKYFSEYDMETEYYDEGERNAKRRQLESKALDFVHPAFTTLLGHLRSKALESFKSRLEQSLNKGEGFAASVRTCTHSCLLEFDQGCADAVVSQANWDASKVCDELQCDIDGHASSVRSAELLKMIANYEEQLNLALTKPVESLLEAAQTDTWASIRDLLKGETQVAVAKLSTNIAGFELDQATVDKMVQKLRDYQRDLVEKKAREKTGEVLIRMKARFSTVFNHDDEATVKDALSAPLKLLSVMAAIRLDEKPDKIEELLFSCLMHGVVALPSSEDGSIRAPTDALSSSTWEEVSPKDTLITPKQSASLSREFKAWAEDKIKEADQIRDAEEEKTKQLYLALTKPIESLLEAGQKDTWASIRKLLKDETQVAVAKLSTYIVGFELGQAIVDKKVQKLRDYGRDLVEKKAKEKAGEVLIRMKSRFSTVFNHDDEATVKDALSASLKLLSVMAAIRLDEKPDKIEELLFSCLMDGVVALPSSEDGSIRAPADALASSTWEEVSPKDTLITPEQCASLGGEFKAWVKDKIKEADKIREAEEAKKKQLYLALTKPVESLLEAGQKDTWASIRKLLKDETQVAVAKLSTYIVGFELGQAIVDKKVQKLRDYGRDLVEKKAKEKAGEVLIRMKSRFSTVFNHDDEATVKDALSASLKLLSVMAAIRLDEKPDKIEELLFSCLMDGVVALPSSEDGSIRAPADALASSTWEEVSPKDTLITPEQCASLGGEFKAWVKDKIKEADKIREAEEAKKKQLYLALTKPVESLLEAGQKDTWASIRKLLKDETQVAVAKLSTYIVGFELGQAIVDKKVQKLRDYGRDLVEKKAKEKAGEVLIRMKSRFSTVFNHDDEATVKDALSASLKLLSVMAAIRLDEKPDKIEELLFSCLMDGVVALPSSEDGSIRAPADALASSTWEEVSPKDTLITPEQCASLGGEFKAWVKDKIKEADKIREAEEAKKKQLYLALTKPIESLLEAGQKDTWASIRKLLKDETQVAVAKLSTYIVGFELGQAIVDKKVQKLRDYGRDLVEKKAKEKAGEVLIRMKSRFSTVFNHDDEATVKDALSASLKLLSVMAAIRLDEKPDKIEELLFSCLMDGVVALPSSEDGSIRAPADALASSTWEEVSPKDTLITPEQCASLGGEFKAWVKDKIKEADKIREAEEAKKKQLYLALTKPIESLLEAGQKDTWASIRKLLKDETQVAVAKLSTYIVGFELGQAIVDKKVQKLRDYGRDLVEKKAKEKAREVLIRMKSRFSTVFNHDDEATVKDALSASLKLLSVMAAIRLDEKPDKIEELLFSYLMDGVVALPSSEDGSIRAPTDALASSTWEEVSPKDTLITPEQCASLGGEFKAWVKDKIKEADKIREAEEAKKKQLYLALTKPVESLLEAGQKDTWASIRKLLKGETQVVVAKLSTYIAGFELGQATVDKKLQKLRDYGRDLVEKKAREKAGEVLIRMKARFSTVFNHDDEATVKDALSASLKLLSVMAAIRLDEKPNKIEELIFSSLMDGVVALPSSEDGSIRAPTDALASSTWEEVSPKDTLITPKQCASLGGEFKAWVKDKIKEADKIREAEEGKKKQLSLALTKPVESLLEAGQKDTWASIRKLLKGETQVVVAKLSTYIAGFELGQATVDKKVQKLRDYGRDLVEKKAREKAGEVLIRMKARFSNVFKKDNGKDALSESLKLLSVMAVIRLDEKPDKIEELLFSSLMDGVVALPSSEDGSIRAPTDALASSTWEEVSSKDTLITPKQCASLWREFKAWAEDEIKEADKIRKAKEEADKIRKAKEEADKIRKAKEEADKIRKAEEEADKIRKAKEEADKIRKAKEEADKIRKAKEEADKIRKAEEEADKIRKAKEEADKIRKAEEEADKIRKAEEEADKIKKAKEEADKIRKAKEEADKIRKAKEEADKIRKAEEEADKIRKAKEEADKIRKAEEEADKIRKAEEEADKIRKAEEEADKIRKAKEEADKIRKAEEEADKIRKAKEEADKIRKAEEEADKIRKAEEEADKIRKAEEEKKVRSIPITLL